MNWQKNIIVYTIIILTKSIWWNYLIIFNVFYKIIRLKWIKVFYKIIKLNRSVLQNDKKNTK